MNDEVVIRLVGEKALGESQGKYEAVWKEADGSTSFAHGDTRAELEKKLRASPKGPGADVEVIHKYGPYEEIEAPEVLPGMIGGVQAGDRGVVIERVSNPTRPDLPAVLVEYTDSQGQSAAFAVYSPSLRNLYSVWAAR